MEFFFFFFFTNVEEIVVSSRYRLFVMIIVIFYIIFDRKTGEAYVNQKCKITTISSAMGIERDWLAFELNFLE